MEIPNKDWAQNQVIEWLRYALSKYPSIKALYNDIIQQHIIPGEDHFSYHQFIRYLKGHTKISEKSNDIISRFLYDKSELIGTLISKNISINLKSSPIQIDMSPLLSYPYKLNLLAFQVISRDLQGRYDAILTHSEAIPIAIAFSQALEIPWHSLSFRRPLVEEKLISQYHYVIDQEIIETGYFHQIEEIKKKKVIIISDYIRRGGLLDILFRIAIEDAQAEIKFLLAIVGIGNEWKRFSTELEGRIRVLKLI
ncbi:MAG: hypothetical protein ACTSW1_08615 [Candidatus Hodarchaeales archaeon]